jgi:tetratricopeptide (TPR) repeat protein
MSKDISQILKQWEFSGKIPQVRRIVGHDGQEKIQRRVEMGILQLETDGRPDGKQPHGFPSLLDYFKDAAERTGAGSPRNQEFRLSSEDCAALQAEALLYYQRRLCHFELHDYEKAAQDARRNLELFSFVRKYAANPDDGLAMDQYRAFVIFHRARAEVLGCLDAKDYGLALNYIRQAESEIRSFYQEQGKDEFFDSSEEIAQIRQCKERIESLRPLTKMEFLESQLQRAVEREEYERAAQIRDEIKRNIRKGRV